MFSVIRPVRRPALTWVVMLAMVVGLTATGNSTASANPGLERDSASYAAAFNVTQVEATRRMILQAQAGQLEALLERRASTVFAGLWLQHQPTYKIIIQYAGGDPAAIASYVPIGLKGGRGASTFGALPWSAPQYVGGVC